MNILFFLTPKAMCSYVDADSTLRQAMERMENSGYTALPILDAEGHYKGVITEGDLLWAFKRLCVMDIRQTEEHSITEIAAPRRAVQPVRADTRVAHVFEQQLALARQADAARAAREEPHLELLLQLFDRLAHRRL